MALTKDQSSRDWIESRLQYLVMAGGDTGPSLEEHDAFFGRIIGMIPREMYKPVEEEEFESKYYKHKKVPLPQDVKKSIRDLRLLMLSLLLWSISWS